MPGAKLTQELVDQLTAARRSHCYSPDLRVSAQSFGRRALALLFPHFSDGSVDHVAEEAIALGELLGRLLRSIARCTPAPATNAATIQSFMDGLPRAYALLQADAEALFQGDPAARSRDEVILTYPGFYAVATYRIAHVLYGLEVPLLPRLLTERAHAETGVDIHPGARIGHGFFIDHGTGVVIGETTDIGNGVKLYQGVTLGALAVEKQMADHKRHPTLEDNVVVYANATILGGNTVVGHDSIVGGNAFLTESVPPFSMVSHQSEVRARRNRAGDEVDFHI